MEALNPNYKRTHSYLARIEKAPAQTEKPAIASTLPTSNKPTKKETAADEKIRLSSEQLLIKKADQVYQDALGLYKAKQYDQARTTFSEFEKLLATNRFPEDYLKNMREKIKKEQGRIIADQRKEAERLAKAKSRAEELARKKAEREHPAQQKKAGTPPTENQAIPMTPPQNKAPFLPVVPGIPSTPVTPVPLMPLTPLVQNENEPATNEAQIRDRDAKAMARAEELKAKAVFLAQQKQEKAAKLAEDRQKKLEQKEMAQQLAMIQKKEQDEIKRQKRLDAEQIKLEQARLKKEKELALREAEHNRQLSLKEQEDQFRELKALEAARLKDTARLALEQKQEADRLIKEQMAQDQLAKQAEQKGLKVERHDELARQNTEADRIAFDQKKIESEVRKRQASLNEEREKVRSDFLAGVEKLYQEALVLHKSQDFEQAKTVFTEIEEIMSDYKMTRQYLARIDQDIAKSEKAKKTDDSDVNLVNPVDAEINKLHQESEPTSK